MKTGHDWHLWPRLQAHLVSDSDACLFTDVELGTLRSDMQSFLVNAGFSCSLTVIDHQPFLLDIWSALAEYTHDEDSLLIPLLKVFL